ncbi:ATP-binding cassette domain-containing protein [Alteromonas ponticola]|uniref:ATP-binding cassette domain-containing protein n=1 Tax=Alteromonas ponticola TaxID=2720613 RepID=A0ABX1R1S4_9ALTE|nr:ATP-binding cassette domain-containing protein [Alteromonas ponticola]NMH59876.1 ATP-binding cassette domain-containing protein [Alteromonas ponticola]
MALSLDNVSIHRFNQPLLTVNFSVAAGEIVCVMGASGAGKSTLLDAISGQLSQPFSVQGDITLNGERINDIPAHRRNIGIMYQDALLYEHLTVGDNIAFALPRSEHHALKASERRARIVGQLDTVGLADFYDRAVQTLSGGQQARVALLRTLAAKPAAVLLDEPFGKLDNTRKEQLRPWVIQQLADRGLPALMVTHDSGDAQAVGGRIIEV